VLSHRQEIEELRHKYCHLVDAEAYAEWASLFVADAELDVEGREPCTSRDEIHAFGTDGVAQRYEYTAHFVCNPVIDVISESEAEGSWYFVLLYTDTDGKTGWQQGRYNEEYERIGTDWKFASVSVTFDIGGVIGAEET
jgi:hypothetical protein